MKPVIFFYSSELPDAGLVGGKALSLMQMLRQGMPVPNGFVLTGDFFNPWQEEIKKTDAWRALSKPDFDLKQVSGALQETCRSLKLDAQQEKELDVALKTLAKDYPGRLYAVRSSSPEEDLEGASFAGGYETTLGVSEALIAAAVLRSFTSAFDERVFLYKKQHGFKLDQFRIAIIIQQQVDADCAGVAFSLNPLNNCYDEAVINANHGLGESVVSGEAEPDQFVVDKVKLEIIESTIGRKQAVITLNQAGGTKRSENDHPQEPALTPVQVLALTQLLVQVETYFQKPIDIEWALSQGDFYLLQARPITSYLPLPEEMLTLPGEHKKLYANSTLIEQGVPAPLSVLGTDFLGYVLKQVAGPVAKESIGPDGITFTASGGYYMNISYALKMGMGKASLAPGSIGDPGITAIMDSISMKQYLSVEIPKHLKASRGKAIFGMLPVAKTMLKAFLNPGSILHSYQAALPGELQRFNTIFNDGDSFKAQAVALSELLQFFYGDYGIPMILTGLISQQRIKGLFKKESNQVQDYLINLGISLPGNKTTEMGELMYALASSEEIHRYATASEFLSALELGRLSQDFVSRWTHFLAEFGMRCPGEIDPATPRPKENPAQCFNQLKNLSLNMQGSTSFFDDARAKREAAYQALHDLALKKGKRRAKALENSYKTWLAFGGYRETPKHYVIKVVDLFRQRVLAIAKTFVLQGRLDQPEQIFDLTIDDIEMALKDADMNLRETGKKRAELINKIKKNHHVVRMIDSRGKIFFPPRKAHVEGELSGVPISPGTAQGRVKVLRYADEKPLLPGEILVARATDPGWTPLFINARGIILEIGGALQHGAVVAREYGIPCVSGLDEATSKLQDGQLVEVDGSNGLVRIIK